MADRCIAAIAKNSRETIRIDLGHFNGHELVHVRVWFIGSDGKPVPSRAGVAFKPELLPEVIAALESAWTEACR